MSEGEIDDLKTVIASDPMTGDEVKGTGGCRKVRFAGRGKGKSGGYRVMTFYTGENFPVFLFAAFGKGQKDNITAAEAKALKTYTKLIVQTYYQKRSAKK